MVFNNNLLLGAAGQSVAFDPTLIGNSVWFNGTDSRMDSPSFSAQSDPTCFIFATWVQILKFGISPAGQYLWSAERTGNYASIRIDNNNKLLAYSDPAQFTSDMIFRDTGWYHIICSYKGSANTVRMFINGVEISNTRLNSLATNLEPVAFSHTQRIGAYYVGATGGDLYEANSYMAQTVFLDGFSFQDGDVTISDFLDTYTFGTNGSQFIPKKNSDLATLAGTAGANSYVLDYADSSNLGNDISANNNDFTVNSMSSANQSANTSSLVYPTLNELDKNSAATLSSGNLRYSSSSSVYHGVRSTFWIDDTTPKIYWEATYVSGGGSSTDPIGLADYEYLLGQLPLSNGTAVFFTNTKGSTASFSNETAQPYNTVSYDADTGDVLRFAYDPATKKLWVGNATNGTYLGGGDPATDSTPTATLTIKHPCSPAVGRYGTLGTTTYDFNFGQTAFTGTVPTGFVSLNSENLTAPDYQGIDYFNAVLYTGNGTAIGSGGKAVTGVGFKPDFAWIKNRDAADSHILTDVVRGVTKYISSNSTAAEATNTEALSTFDTDGFTVGNLDAVNTNTENYVSWNWLAGGTGSSNTNGSINSTVTVADAGHLSIGTYTGTGANATVGHGLTGAPEFVNVKQLNSTASWSALIPALGNSKAIFLNLPNAAQTVGAAYWQNTDPTSTVFSIGTDNAVNALSSTYVFQCFRSVPGVCKVGTYAGNSSDDGPYLSLGFKPAWWMVKETTLTDASHDWFVSDSARYVFNGTTTAGGSNGGTLEANDSTAEEAHSTNFADNPAFDFLADGIKLRSNSGTINATGRTYLYIAMADLGGNGTLPPIYGR